MKIQILLLAFLFFSEKLLAQSTVIQPELFRLATVESINCPIADKGKVFYDLNDNKFKYCSKDNSSSMSRLNWSGNSDIYYFGKIGLANTLPTYDLDLTFEARSETLLVTDNVGINTVTPTEKLELKDRGMGISSTADGNSWSFTYSDVDNRLRLIEKGVIQVFFANGGNIGIGTIASTEKLRVLGDVSYSGNLTVEGKGIVSNSSATQLKMISVSLNTGLGFSVNANSCATSGFGLGSSTFTSPPTVSIGQKTSSGTNDSGLILSVESVTNTGGLIKFCNNKNVLASIPNYTYSLIAVGEGN